MNDKDKNCGTCHWRTIETRSERLHDYRMLTATIITDVVWFCNNSESYNYMKEVSNPHGYCDAWEG